MKKLFLLFVSIAAFGSAKAAWYLACYRGNLYVVHVDNVSGLPDGASNMGIACGSTNYASRISGITLTSHPGLPADAYDRNAVALLNNLQRATVEPLPADMAQELQAQLHPDVPEALVPLEELNDWARALLSRP